MCFRIIRQKENTELESVPSTVVLSTHALSTHALSTHALSTVGGACSVLPRAYCVLQNKMVADYGISSYKMFYKVFISDRWTDR